MIWRRSYPLWYFVAKIFQIFLLDSLLGSRNKASKKGFVGAQTRAKDSSCNWGKPLGNKLHKFSVEQRFFDVAKGRFHEFVVLD